MYKEIILIAIGALFINNLIFIKFFGISTFIGVSKNPDIIFGLGLSVTIILTVMSALTFLVYKYILEPLNIIYFKSLVFIIIITFFIIILTILIKKSDSLIYKYLGRYLPLISSNSLILGICLFNFQEISTFFSCTLYGFFSGISYTVSLFIISNIKEKLELSDIPGPFKGIPITLITAGIISMIIMAIDRTFIAFLK